MTKELELTLSKESNIYRRFYKGFEYWIIRPNNALRFTKNPITIHLCGYVVIPKDSKYFESDDYYNYDIDCHWGLTFAGSIEPINVDFAIGFDCAHCNDINRLDDNWESSNKATYKDVNYVDEECKSIIDQLIKQKG